MILIYIYRIAYFEEHVQYVNIVNYRGSMETMCLLISFKVTSIFVRKSSIFRCVDNL